MMPLNSTQPQLRKCCRCSIAATIEAIPSMTKNATKTIVRVNMPASGRTINTTPSTIASIAARNDQAKPGVCRERHTQTARKSPATKNSQPTNISTASVARTGTTTARKPRTIITTPWARNSFQCAWIVKANWRRSPSISVWLLILEIPPEPPNLNMHDFCEKTGARNFSLSALGGGEGRGGGGGAPSPSFRTAALPTSPSQRWRAGPLPLPPQAGGEGQNFATG